MVAQSGFHAEENGAYDGVDQDESKKALRDSAYQVEDLCKGQLDDIHALRLKLFRDDEIDENAITSQALQSKTGVVVLRLLSLCPLKTFRD